jgi:tetratricopeptide (TPR) repeat protein
MILTRESRRTWWLIMIAAWAAAIAFAVSHAVAMRGYTAMLDGAAPRVPAVTTPKQHIVPTNYADAQTWVRYALTFDEGAPWQVRHTVNDNAPQGREVHWSSGFAHLLSVAAKIRRGLTGEPLPLAMERVLPWFNLPLLVMVFGSFSYWVGRRAGAGAGVLIALGIVGTEMFYGGFSPHYVDHHGMLTAATFGVVLGALFMGAGWWRASEEGTGQLLPASWLSARNAAILSAVSGAVGLWFSAASTIPAIALTGFGGLAATLLYGRSSQREGAVFDAGLWRIWGRVGAAGSLVFYLIEYAPFHLGLRLEVNHPFFALAWLGGSEIVALIGERWLATEKQPWPPAWRLVWPLAAVAVAPLTILVGGVNVFVVSDPFVAEIPKTVAEGLSLPVAMKAFGWKVVFQYVNWNLIPFIVAVVLLCLPRQREKHLLFFAGAIALGFFGLTFMQIRWAFGSSGPMLVLLFVVLAAVLQSWRPLVRWLVVVVFVGVCFVPQAVRRVTFLNSIVAQRMPDRMDLQQILYRDAAAYIRGSQPEGDIVLLASPNGSCGMGYYGNFKTIGTLYWENYGGMRAAAEIFSAFSEEKARELIKARGITHIAMISEESFLEQYFTILHPELPVEDLKKTFGYGLLVNQALPAWLRPIPYAPPPDAKMANLRVILLQVVPEQTDWEGLWHIALAQLALGEESNTVRTFEASIMKAPAAERLQRCQIAANICYTNGAHAAAVRLYRDALTAGENPLASCNLAWILATSKNDAVRNGREALTIAQGLITTHAEDPTALSALAAAQAEIGNFSDAILAAEKALERVRGASNKNADAQFAARLDGYRAGNPWRQ